MKYPKDFSLEINRKKSIFRFEKQNLEPIGNMHTTEYLAFEKALLAKLYLKVKVYITKLQSVFFIFFFMAPFHGWGSTASRLGQLWGGSLLFTNKFPEIPGTHFINLGRIKDWVNLAVTQWFWTRDPWIGNPAP